VPLRSGGRELKMGELANNNTQKISEHWTGFNTFSVVFTSILWLFEVAVVSPALGLIETAFPEATHLEITMVMSMPFLSVFVFSLISGGILAKKFDTKIILIVGLIVYGISGILPAFADSISTILVLRFITGIGCGLIVPHSNIIISRQFTGDKRKRLLGWNNSLANFSYVGINLVVGALLVFGWHFAFYSFVFVFVVLVFVIIGIPSIPPIKKDVSESGAPMIKEKLSPKVFGLACVMGLNFALFGFMPTNLSMMIIQNELAGVGYIGMIIAVISVAGIAGSLLVPEIVKIFKKYTIFVAFFLGALGFFVLYALPTLTGILIANILVGLGMQGFLPTILFDKTAGASSFRQRDEAFGIVNSSIYLGSFVGPFIQTIVTLIGKNDSISFIFFGGTVIMVVITVVSLIFAIRSKEDIKQNRIQ
jgi:MFS family permease